MKKEPTLQELQDDLFELFTNLNETKADKKAKSDRVLEFLESTKQFDIGNRVGVYKDAYFLRLEEAMSEDFSTTKRLLGDEAWERLVRQYFGQYPSVYASLADVGRQFPHFLAHEAEGVSRVVKDMSQLEWAVVEVFYSKNVSDVDMDSFQLLKRYRPQDIFLEINPSIRWQRAHHNIVDVYDEESKIQETPQCVLVYRRQGAVFLKKLSDFQYELIVRMGSGENLGDAMQALTSHLQTGEDIASVQKSVQQLVHLGVFLRAELKN